MHLVSTSIFWNSDIYSGLSCWRELKTYTRDSVLFVPFTFVGRSSEGTLLKHIFSKISMNVSNDSCVRADVNAVPSARNGSVLIECTKSCTLLTVAVKVFPVEIFLKKLYVLTSFRSSGELPLLSRSYGRAGDVLLGKHGIGAQNEALKVMELTISELVRTRHWKCKNVVCGPKMLLLTSE